MCCNISLTYLYLHTYFLTCMHMLMWWLSACDRPRVIESLRDKEVVDVAAGGAHSACVTSAGELFTWGKGRYGRLGHGDSDDQARPKLVRVCCVAIHFTALSRCFYAALSVCLEYSLLCSCQKCVAELQFQWLISKLVIMLVSFYGRLEEDKVYSVCWQC